MYYLNEDGKRVYTLKVCYYARFLFLFLSFFLSFFLRGAAAF